MTAKDLPEDVKQVVRDHILSLEQLEILLLLKNRDGSELSAQAVNEVLMTSETSAATRLADLERRGFLSSRHAEGRTLYHYEPQSTWLRQAVELLDSAYAERRYTIIELIFSKPLESLAVFAGAFRFKKDDSDG